METEKDIGIAIKERLESFKSSPDDFVWGEIETKLIKRKKKRRFIFWFWTIGLGLVLVSFFMFSPKEESELKDNDENKTHITNHVQDSNTTSSMNLDRDNNENDTFITNNNEDSNITSTTNAINLDRDSISNKNNTKTNSTKVIENLKKQNINIVSTQKDTSNLNFTETSGPSIRAKSKLTTSILGKSKKDGSVLIKKPIKNQLNSSSSKTNGMDRTIADNGYVTDTKVKDSPTDSLKNHLEISTISEKDVEIPQATKEDSLSTSEEQIKSVLELEPEQEKPILDEKNKDTLNPKTSDSKWHISPIANLSSYNSFNEKTTENLTFNYGLLVGYEFKNKLIIRAGIKRTNLKQSFKKDTLSITNDIEYLEFPLELKYLINKNNFRPYIIGGLSYFMLQNARSNNQSNSDYSSTFSASIGLGIEKKIFNKLSLFIEPNFKYQFKPIRRNDELNPYILNFNFGILYRF